MYLSEQVLDFENLTVQRDNITYDLEVKSTVVSLRNPALLSNNQIFMAKKCSGRFCDNGHPKRCVHPGESLRALFGSSWPVS